MAGLSGIINVYKPKGITSHDVVYKLRKILGIKKIGHTGTLDPDAEGVLPMCIGRATKTADMLTAADKEYMAEVTLGFSTDTQDSSGSVIKSVDMDDFIVSSDDIENAVTKYIGDINQLPPMYSAIKIGGKKLYELARQGIEIERKPRFVKINSIKLLDFYPNKEHVMKFKMLVSCSKGTYIRALCNDIGEDLKCFAHMSVLVRTKSGRFDLEHSYKLSEIENMAAIGNMSFFTPVDEVFSEYGKLVLSDNAAFKMCNGTQVKSPAEAKDGVTYRVYDINGKFLTISRAENGKMKILKTFYQD